MRDNNVTYWAEQVRAIITDEPNVEEQHEDGFVVIGLPDENNTREGRAKLIRTLERCGITVRSETTNENIVIKADDTRLKYSLA